MNRTALLAGLLDWTPSRCVYYPKRLSILGLSLVTALTASAARCDEPPIRYRVVVTTGNSGLGENNPPGLHPYAYFDYGPTSTNRTTGFGGAGALGDSGRAAFSADVGGVSVTRINSSNNQGIWKETADGWGGNDPGTTLVVRKGDALPNGSGERFGSLGTRVSAFGSDGIAFSATIHNSANQSIGNSIWTHTEASGFREIVRSGQAAPGTSGTFNSISAQVNDAGRAVIKADLPYGTGPGGFGLWRTTTDGSLQKIAFTGDAAGQTGATFTHVSRSSNPTIDHSGRVQFTANLSDTGQNSLWSHTEAGGLELLAKHGDALSQIGSGVTVGSVRDAFQTNDGGSIFHASLAGAGVTTANREALLTNQGGGGWRSAIRAGDTVEGLNGVRLGPTGTSSFPVFSQVQANGDGKVAFVGTLTGSGVTSASNYAVGNDRAVIAQGTGGTFDVVARQGDVAPGTNGAVFGKGWNYSGSGRDTDAFLSLRQSATGQVAFVGNLAYGIGDSNSGYHEQGIWATDPLGQLRLVARRGPNGTPLDFLGTGARIATPRGFDELILGQFNDLGQLTFFAESSNSADRTVFVADLGSATVGDLLTVATGKTYEVPGTVSVNQGGTLTLESGSSLTLGPSGLDITGTVVNNGTITGDVFIGEGGSLSGSGTILGTVTNDGTFNAGNSPGVATLEDFINGTTGVLEVEIGGTADGEFDIYQYTSSMTLDGTLKLLAWDGFVASHGDSFEFIRYIGTGIPSLTGTFALDDSLFRLGGGLEWHVEYAKNGSVFVNVVDGSPSDVITPEPGSLALLATGGLGLIGGWVRRRRGRAGVAAAA